MKCLVCGKESNLLCDECHNEEGIETLFNDLVYFNESKCENQNVIDFMNNLTDRAEAVNYFIDILKSFDEDTQNYYLCRIHASSKDDRFENEAVTYLSRNTTDNPRYQVIVGLLIDYYCYRVNDFDKPSKYCLDILNTNNLKYQTYLKAADYFSKVGDYDLSDKVIDKLTCLCSDYNYINKYNIDVDYVRSQCNERKETTYKYRTKKPYWPNPGERRDAIILQYNKRGIELPISNFIQKAKIKNDNFKEIIDNYDYDAKTYSAFWCVEVSSAAPAKDICQIAAVKVRDGEILDKYVSYIRPWKDGTQIKCGAKTLGIDLKEMDSQRKVTEVIPEFFKFVGDNILVSTDAGTTQAELLKRACRYAGLDEIKNELLDLSNFAAEEIEEFELNNKREALVKYFKINDKSKNALDKAMVNVELMNKLQTM